MRLTSSSAGAGTAGEWQSSRRTLWEHGIHSATATTTGRSRLCLARTPGLHCLSTLPPHARPFGARLLGASDAPARYSLLARGAGVGGRDMPCTRSGSTPSADSRPTTAARRTLCSPLCHHPPAITTVASCLHPPACLPA
ncbi:hypothetical protein L1887_62807 [Cichorium endivia]|nr:hypothetical protein L1887_62807 [Cichorium endivia]